MHPFSIKVWYFCKECTISFEKLEDFFEHKNRVHFSDLQNAKCIVFEERIENEYHQHVSSPANLVQDFEPQLNEGEVVCGLQDSLNISDVDLHNTEDSFKWELLSENDNENIGNETVPQNLQSDSDFGAFCNVNLDADLKLAIFSSKNNSNEETMETTTTTGENIDSRSFDFEPHSQAQLSIYENKIKVENKSQKISVVFDTRVKALQNPYIRLTRLTSKEIEQYKQRSTQANLGDSAASFECESEIPLPATSLKYECQLCSKKLDSEPQLKIHVGICSLYHKDRHRFCVPCNRKFVTAQSLKVHCLRYHGTNKLMNEPKKSKPLPCNTQLMSKNKKVSVKRKSTMQHQVNGSNRKRNKLHKCDKCSYSTNREDMITAHKLKKHSGERSFKCSQPNCERAFKARCYLWAHMTSHSVEKPFKCDHPNCDRSFKYHPFLVDHQLTHSSLLPSKSPTNKKSTVKCSSSIQHQVDGITNSKNKSYKIPKCDQFGSSSTRKDGLATHKTRKHSNKKPLKWLCSHPNCGNGFETRDRLQKHKAFHRDETPFPFQCNYPNCDRVFKRKCNLMDHQVITKHLQESIFVEPTAIVRATPRYVLPKGVPGHSSTSPFCDRIL